ncbi:Secreted RxLR effector protein 82 [Frankliniella fusca]|uniref:Secreted RxLR effector protein 82 n=1 Tax=Frankliniella fusca TaxID=407009 RepID=A0AAE1LKI5_9NEOP|nr:Secreted RxLR effector protein 82 [Frankliniella fusca]
MFHFYLVVVLVTGDSFPMKVVLILFTPRYSMKVLEFLCLIFADFVAFLFTPRYCECDLFRISNKLLAKQPAFILSLLLQDNALQPRVPI